MPLFLHRRKSAFFHDVAHMEWENMIFNPMEISKVRICKDTQSDEWPDFYILLSLSVQRFVVF